MRTYSLQIRIRKRSSRAHPVTPRAPLQCCQTKTCYHADGNKKTNNWIEPTANKKENKNSARKILFDPSRLDRLKGPSFSFQCIATRLIIFSQIVLLFVISGTLKIISCAIEQHMYNNMSPCYSNLTSCILFESFTFSLSISIITARIILQASVIFGFEIR